MKLKAEQDLSCDEIEITIKYPQKDRQVERMLDFLQSFDMQLPCAEDHAENKLQAYGFVQISKSCILNINVLESIRPLFNSRMEAALKNGEKVTINRSYLHEVKKALGGKKEE